MMNVIKYSKKTPIQERYWDLRGRTITIAGPPGAGKSKLCKDVAYYLNKHGLDAKYFKEYVNKELLDLYLENGDSMKKYAFPFQVIMIQRRIAIYKEAMAYAKTGGIAIIDGPINTDNAFELLNYYNGNITEKEHQVYMNIMNEFEEMPAPDYVVYLNSLPDTTIKRVKRRGRINEIKNYNHQFYQKLYMTYSLAFSGVRVSVIPYDEDYEMEDERLPEKEVFNLLSCIQSRALEQIGINNLMNFGDAIQNDIVAETLKTLQSV